MQPVFETIQPNPGNSFFYACGLYGATEPFWHIHPEYELVYMRNGSAEQHIGTHYSKYNDGTLLLIGPNIPHSNMGNYDNEDNIAVVIQMSREFLEQKILAFNELSFIEQLLTRSKQGICFDQSVKNSLSEKLEEIALNDPYHRLLGLIEILKQLALTNNYKLLNANSIDYNLESNAYQRVYQITRFVENNYHRQVHLNELASLTRLTESSFSRFFKQITGKNFVSFINEYRIHKACELLSDKQYNISEIMYKTGFNEAAHFTRVFKKVTGFTPREYRFKLLKSPRLKLSNG